jgi:HPt (histidine-containing phosphotransfer) domain-containing protein
MDLTTMFEEDAPAVLNELLTALETDDAKEARRAVHSLRGLASTFFAFPTVEMARQFEADAAAGRLESLKKGGLEQLKQAVQSLTIELRDRGLIHPQ